MTTVEASTNPTDNRGELRDRWLARLEGLVGQIEGWARDFEWATRRIEKTMEDARIGTYRAPALILQHETTRAMLEPIARSAPGAEGVVDLYLMPAYDDIASLYFYDGAWQLHHLPGRAPIVATINEAEHRPLTKDSLGAVLEEMVRNHAV